MTNRLGWLGSGSIRLGIGTASYPEKQASIRRYIHRSTNAV